MGTVADPRKEVLTASRFRSGSLQREKSENMPPSLQPRQNSEKGDNSPTRQRTTGENYNSKSNSRTALFGSNVSKIKEMFQSNAPPPSSKTDLHHHPPDVEKSPESKRKKTEFGTRTRQAPIQQPHSEQGLLDATNHVQRFIHTRALFARLEEATYHGGGSEQKKGGVATPSPIISPNTSTPTSPTASKHPGDDFKHAGDARSKHDREESSHAQKGSFLENRPTTLNINATKNYNSGLLWKRRQNENSVGGNLYGGGKKGDEENMDVDDTFEQSNTKYDLSVTSGYRSRSAESGRRAFHCDRIRSVSNDRGQNLPHSSTQRHYISSSSAEHSDDNTEVVMRRRPESNKRLSKQEIQAAIDKADNYLTHLTTGSDFQSKRRSWELREQMSESCDSKVGPISRLTPRNRSRSADTLDSDENESTRNKTYYTDRYRINRTSQKSNDKTNNSNSSNATESSDKLSNVSNSKVQSDLSETKSNVPSKPPVPSKPTPSVGRHGNSPRPVPSPRKPAPPIPHNQVSEPAIQSSVSNYVHSSRSPLNKDDETIEKVQNKPTTPSSVQIEVVSSLLGDDLRPDTPQSVSSMTSSPRDSPPPPPMSPPPPLPQSSVPLLEVDHEQVNTVIAGTHSVLEDRPPPPPYPDESREPPPPYPATSHQKVDDPPPAPHLTHEVHGSEDSSEYGVQMRTKFGAEISESEDDDPRPPEVTVDLVSQMSPEQQRSTR